MESVVFNVSHKQFFISNTYWILFYFLLTIVGGLIIFPSLPVIFDVGIFLFMLIDNIIFNRGMRKIVEIAANNNEIILTYYKLWLKRTITVSRKTFGKILIERKRNNTKIFIYIYDKRWLRPPCMYIQFSKSKVDYLENNICNSQDDIEKAIALLEKYNYHIEFENK
jgi:hypothetical protein